MAITITQHPTDQFDMAYGANPITLNGILPTQDKYALQIFIVGQADPIADIRQSPNRFARAIFDIQNILQSLVGPTTNNIDALGVTGSPMQIAQGELVQYQIAYTTETGGTLDDPFTTDPQVFTAIAGSKQYWEVPFDATKYQAQIQSTIDGCTTLNPNAKDPQGLALSDNTWTIDEESTGDEFYADNFRSPDGITMHNVYPEDQLTKSFYNVCRRNGSNPPIFQAQGIEAFLLIEFAANGQLVSETEIDNTQSNGGGPNLTMGQGLIPTGNYQVVTMGVGPAQLDLNPLTVTYYIQPLVLSPTGGSCGSGGYMTPSGWRTQGFRINQEPCNDYSHIQFAWLNSLGFRDQFTFTKKNEKVINTKRNQFLKEAADYNSTDYNVDVQSRGYTTYSQTIRETWSATTGYINDEEAKLLESMFKSAQVNARFSEGSYKDQWVPVKIETANYTQKTNRKDRLFQYTVKFTLASNIKSQRG
jgi:hypothetical protein